MPLTKQQAVVPFVGGVNVGQNEFLLQPPNLLNLENGVFRDQGEISKRYGFSALKKDIFNTDSTIQTGNRIETFNNDLILFTDTNLYSYAEGSQEWFDKGAFASVEVFKDSIVRNRDSQTVPTTATVNGITLTAWEDTRNGGEVRYVVTEDSTGSVVKSEVPVGANSVFPVCVTLNNRYLCLLYIDTLASVIKSIVLNPQDLATTLTNTSLINVAGAQVFDVISYENLLCIAYNNGSSNTTVSLLEFDVSDGLTEIGSSVSVLNTGSEYESDAVAVFADRNNNSIFIASNTGGSIRLQGTFQDLATPVTANVLVENTGATVNNITGIARSTDGHVILAYEIDATNTQNHYIKAARYSFNGTDTLTQEAAPAVIKRSVGLASHLFEENEAVYATSAHESGLQPTYFVLEFASDSEAPIAAKVLSSIAGGHTAKPSLPRLRTDANGFRFTSLLELTRLTTDTGTISDNTGIVRITLNFDTPPFQSQQLGQNLLVAGGYITAYDGTQVVEHGFHLFPEAPTAAVTNDAGGTLNGFSNGIYSFRVIYEWSDAKGQIHRSTPSITITETAPDATSRVTVTAPTLRLTSKEDVKIVLYASLAGGSILYRAAEVNNDTTVDSVDLVFNDDTNLNTQEILYTTGGTVENIAPPAASLMQTHQNRIFLAGLENENELWYSKESVQNEGLGFSDFFRLRINPAGGAITALGTLDDKLIIFKENSIFALSGQGPVDTGAQNDFQQPEQISSEVGCTSPNSIVLISEGLMFQSGDGIKLLNRGLEVVEIGEAVSDFKGLNITSGVLLPNDDEVRFTSSDGQCLVYSTAYGMWSLFTNFEAVSATLWRNVYIHLKDDGTVNLETVGAYTDNNAPITLKLETPWLAFNGLLGYKRIYELMMLGKRLTEHAFRVSISYDYSDLIRQIVYFNTAEGMDSGSYTPSSSAVIPSLSENLATGNPVYQFRIKPTIQKCESFKLTISDIPLNGTLGAGYILTGMNALVGVDTARHLPVPASQSVGGR